MCTIVGAGVDVGMRIVRNGENEDAIGRFYISGRTLRIRSCAECDDVIGFKPNANKLAKGVVVMAGHQ